VYNIAATQRLASAAAVFHGRHGDVTALARQRAVPRQALYREAHAAHAALQDDPAQHLRPLRQRLDEQQRCLEDLRRQLRHAVVLDGDRQAEFAATAQALGVSLTAAHALLHVVLRQDTPSRSTLGRLAQAAARRATTTLAVLDQFSRPRARQVAADEIFAGRRPVLMTVEQESLCWLGARQAARRDGAEWAHEFQQLPALEQVTRDGGQGLRKGLELVNAQRRRDGQPEVADQEDHFHLLQWARRALREVRQKAVRALRQAEAAQHTFERDAYRGLRRSPMRSRLARLAWRKAEQAFDRWSAHERAFERLRAALRLFTPEGALTTRARAEAQVREALSELTGPEWAWARRRLAAPETFTFLDRAQQRLAALPVAAEARAAAVRAEGLRRQPEGLQAPGPRGAAGRGVALLAGVVLALLGEAGRQAVQAVRGVLQQTWRASSLVEGVNSVLRMHQARQKRLTPELLALKRLHWNRHVFVAGRRKGQSPYERLGVVLPGGSWWSLLKIPPEQLRQQLSALNPAP
jgi:hypothetical protein